MKKDIAHQYDSQDHVHITVWMNEQMVSVHETFQSSVG